MPGDRSHSTNGARDSRRSQVDRGSKKVPAAKMPPPSKKPPPPPPRSRHR